MKTRYLWAGAGSLAALISTDVWAADASVSVLEDVVVTAQKREQRLVDVPMTIAVLSGDDVAQRGIDSVQDLSFAVPGLTMREDGPGSYTIFIRGISNQYGNGALVGVYLDEAPLSLTGYDQLEFRPLDLDRIEVLKGPQGTLYGEGSVSGAIRYVTKDPVLNAFQGRVEAGVATVDGGNGQQSITGIVNLPLVDGVFGVRLAGEAEHGGGWQDQPAAGILNGNGQDLEVGRLKALWKVSDAFDIKATVIVHRDKTQLGLGYENPDHTIFVAIDPATVLIPKRFNYDLYNLDATYNFGAAQLVSSSTYTYLDHHYPFSYIGGPDTIYGGVLSGNDTRHVAAHEFSQELRLSSLGQGAFTWTLGGFFKHLTRDFDDTYDTDYAGTLYNNLLYITDDTYKSYSLFGDAAYHLTDRAEVGVGARYFHDEQTTFDGTTTQSGSFHSTDPRVYASYKVANDVNVYGSVAKGFRSGGFNVAPLPSYGPESLITYELGLKGLAAGGDVRFELAAYYSDYSDMLRRGLVFVPASFTFESLTSNIGTVHIKGLEGGLTWRVTKQLTLDATASAIDSKVVTINAKNATNLPGDLVDYVPKFAGTLGANYSVNWPTGKPGYVRVDYNYRDKLPYTDRSSFTAANVPQYSDDIGLLDARLGVDWGKANLELYGLNLTNANKWIDPYHAWDNANRTRPRMVGIKVGYNFQ